MWCAPWPRRRRSSPRSCRARLLFFRRRLTTAAAARLADGGGGGGGGVGGGGGARHSLPPAPPTVLAAVVFRASVLVAAGSAGKAELRSLSLVAQEHARDISHPPPAVPMGETAEEATVDPPSRSPAVAVARSGATAAVAASAPAATQAMRLFRLFPRVRPYAGQPYANWLLLVRGPGPRRALVPPVSPRAAVRRPALRQLAAPGAERWLPAGSAAPSPPAPTSATVNCIGMSSVSGDCCFPVAV